MILIVDKNNNTTNILINVNKLSKMMILVKMNNFNKILSILLKNIKKMSKKLITNRINLFYLKEYF